MRIFLIISFLFLGLNAKSQGGNYYLKNYEIPLQNLEHKYFSSVQGIDGQVFFANIHGVLIYDGAHWELINTPSTPYSIGIHPFDENILLAGCLESFGMIRKNGKNQFYYTALLDSGIQKKITNIINLGKSSYFYSSDALYIYNFETNTHKIIKPGNNSNSFNGFFRYKDQIFVNIKDKGLHILTNDNFIANDKQNVFGDESIINAEIFDENRIIIATDKGNFYLFDGHNFSPYSFQGINYIQVNSLSNILKLSEDELIISTLSGGCMAINTKMNREEKIINYQGGLPDDEIFTMCKDNQGGLWIAHEYGITRVDKRIPVRNYSVYPGLEGNLFSSFLFKDQLYITTSEGIFYLDTVTSYKDIEYLIKKEQKSQNYIYKYKKKKIIKKEINISFHPQDKDGKILLDSTPIIYDIPIEFEIEIDSVSGIVKDIFENVTQKRIYAKHTIPYMFKKIKGIEGKCRQIFNVGEQLVASTNFGIFEIKNGVAKQIIKEQYIHYLVKSMYPDILLAGHNDGLTILKFEKDKWSVQEYVDLNAPVYSIAEKKGNLLLGSDNYVYKIRHKNYKDLEQPISFNIHKKYKEQIIVRNIGNQLSIFSRTGNYYLDPVSQELLNDPVKNYKDSSNIIFYQENNTWVKDNNHWINLNNPDLNLSQLKFFLNLFLSIEDIHVDEKGNLWVISENNLYCISESVNNGKDKNLSIYINNARDSKGNLLDIGNLLLPYTNNSLTIDLSSLYYLGEESFKFQYHIEGLQKKAIWSTEPTVNLPYLPSGQYYLRIRGKNIFDEVSEDILLPFKIMKPFWEQTWFYISTFILLSLIVFLLIKFRTRQLEKAKQILQQKVLLATAEIRKQKEELEIAYEKIEKKNSNSTASIVYAERIQEAILALELNIAQSFREYFILYHPLHIVSGDFYWFHQHENIEIIVAADCTGHGVPGAFMSMIGASLLNEIIKEKNIFDPAKILMLLDEGITKSLKQDREDAETSDGMDIAICTVYREKKEIHFAGAHNPLLIVKNGEMKEIDSDRYGIGGKLFMPIKKTFSTKIIPFEEDACYYIFSDGYADQPGGPKRKKFNYGRLYQLLIDISPQEMEKQKIILEENLIAWMEDFPQRDDILLIGFKI